ncbi:ATP-dependent RNA helicase Ddx1 [Daktulosphaira vitifoliae]|uniref:ATP-dependent RNA helicase Ddx1 n=1 Tax=Daktulosphaira vitifoliae TaxID=58002 RepID=UPI0021AAC3C0|nr:ATP-dependent RNA helicase Ddx1 [Daktulosphaira vitifoliae]
MAAFEEMGVLPEIGKAVEEIDWLLPTDVQAEAIPLILGGGDVLMAAETGSGKTGAFCIPIIQIVWETIKQYTSGQNITSVKTINILDTWKLNLWDRSNSTAITPDGLRCQSREQKEWHGCRATNGVKNSGKFYFEATVTDEGLCRVGWSTFQASLDLGTDKFGFGFGGTGRKSNNKQFDLYGETFGLHDTIGCWLDLDVMIIGFSKNGTYLGDAFQIPPSLKNSSFYPAVVLKNAEMSFNFGDSNFKYDFPKDFTAVSKASKNNTEISQNKLSKQNSSQIKRPNNAPFAIIIEPSRELAEQTCNQIKKIKKFIINPNVKDLLVVGGISVKEQISSLSSGVDIVVGTPGRLEDLISGGHLSLAYCRFFILDEADGLLKQRYTPLIENMHRQMPKITHDGKRLQMIVCSATLHDFEVKKLASKLMHFPTWVDLKGEDTVPETVHHVVVTIDPQKDISWTNCSNHIPTDGVHNRDNIKAINTSEALSHGVKILKGTYCIKAINKYKMDKAIIFCRTKLDCDNLEKYFNQLGSCYSCCTLHGSKNVNDRKANLDRFKSGDIKFLICTDVAARGIDVNHLPFMINMTLPDEKTNYVHRIGRVGRAERMGLAISFVSSVPEKVWYHGEWCPSRGQRCSNTNLTSNKGCCIWYSEHQYLADIEDHLNITIQQVGPDIDIPINEFDGKVVYGQKKSNNETLYKNHYDQLLSTICHLTQLENKAQLMYLQHFLNT